MANRTTKEQADESTALLAEDDYGRSAFRTSKEHGITWRKALVFVLQLAMCIIAGCLLLPPSPPFGIPAGNPVRNALLFAWISVVMVTYEAKLLYMERQFRLWEISS